MYKTMKLINEEGGRLQLDADTLLDFASHHRQNGTRSRKSTHVKKMRVHSAVPRGKLTK
jgi:hypothetical protein